MAFTIDRQLISVSFVGTSTNVFHWLLWFKLATPTLPDVARNYISTTFYRINYFARLCRSLQKYSAGGLCMCMCMREHARKLFYNRIEYTDNIYKHLSHLRIG